MIMDAKTHDHATASISHLPHIIAASLVNLIRETDDENETMKTIAAGGFKRYYKNCILFSCNVATYLCL